MKRAGMALLGLVLVTSSCVAPLDENASGEEVYAALCARCHGSNLEGGVGPALGAGSDLVDKPDAYLLSTVTNGRGRMPAFKASLSAGQIDRVASYLRDRQAG